jgi:tetratricopeptide (TPR) repeat protein
MQIRLRLHGRRLVLAVSFAAVCPALRAADSVSLARLPSTSEMRRLPETNKAIRVASDPYPNHRDPGPVAVDLTRYLPEGHASSDSSPRSTTSANTAGSVSAATSLQNTVRSGSKSLACVAKLSERSQGSDRRVVDAIHSIPAQPTHDWSDSTSVLASASEQAAQLVKRASTRASRGAIYSARHELEASLTTLSQALDSHYDSTAFSQCLHDGLQAMKEAEDFSPTSSVDRSALDVPLIVKRHRSRVLTADEAEVSSAIEAARKYYSYAQEHLVAAVGGSPVAAHALFGMGKLYMGMSQSDSDAERVYGPRAMMMHQSALLIDGSHHLAANELGVLLARFGRLREARDVFQHGLAVNSLPATWRNLADVHERLGEGQLAIQARAEFQRTSQLAQQQNPNSFTAPNGLTVQWVDKATFERGFSNGVLNSQPTATPAARPNVANRPARPSQW